jgi:hypothetical protein
MNTMKIGFVIEDEGREAGARAQRNRMREPSSQDLKPEAHITAAVKNIADQPRERQPSREWRVVLHRYDGDQQ